ncbi:hypothetical protein N7530_007097 [Penicillium desertorum]|uniref:Cystathionine gamma-synthase n=1 Tax=Penicillium desertorum TaxID=1303715 RepID=A0A9W9WT83_9EURO|nr:hypothetical protein N7530_007097 [Penicillium desertorum]
MAGEAWVRKTKQTIYPWLAKFCKSTSHTLILIGQNGILPATVGRLTEAALRRVKRSAGVKARIFVSKEAASRLERTVKEKDTTANVSAIDFKVHQSDTSGILNWAHFVLLLFPESFEEEAFTFWLNHGDGISNRHAEFCLELLDFMDTRCEENVTEFQTNGPRSGDAPAGLAGWTNSGFAEKSIIKSVLSETIKSRNATMAPVQPQDVFLYSTGMMAIGKIARAMSDMSGDAAAVVFGEITSNPQLHSPNLVRIGRLADTYGFTVVVDDTIGTSANLDILPYADVVTTSLTKIFNGACNAMGGSLIVNPNSQHHKKIHGYLQDHFEDLLFPADAVVLSKNCVDYPDRVRQCSTTARAIAHLLAEHPSVNYVNYPTLVPSRAEYERYRRDEGGYGYLLSVVFRDPEFAVRFYDALDVWKGPSIGTNSSIALPYSLLAHWEEQDWAAQFGVPKHIVRLSVGLEPEDSLRARVCEALAMAAPATLRRATLCKTEHQAGCP